MLTEQIKYWMKYISAIYPELNENEKSELVVASIQYENGEDDYFERIVYENRERVLTDVINNHLEHIQLLNRKIRKSVGNEESYAKRISYFHSKIIRLRLELKQVTDVIDN